MTPDDFQNLEAETARLRNQLEIAMKRLADVWPPKPVGDAAATSGTHATVYLYDGAGADGTGSTRAAYAYTIKDAAGTVLAMGLQPKQKRVVGRTEMAEDGSEGIAEQVGTDWVLLVACGECPYTKPCDPV